MSKPQRPGGLPTARRSLYRLGGRTHDALLALARGLRIVASEAVVVGMSPSVNLYRNRLFYDMAALNT
jgi:hypothetical protein